MQSFSSAMRAYIRSGLSPASAMRSTWADVRRGDVARPPRGKRGGGARRNAGELVHVDVTAGRRATHNPRVRRLKHRGRVYDVLARDPGLIPHTLPGYLVRSPGEKAVKLARVSPGRVEYVTGVAQSTRQLGRPYREAIRRYRGGNPPPPDRGVCFYCQRRVGDMPGWEHSESCPRYRPLPKRRPRTIGRKPRPNPSAMGSRRGPGRVPLGRVGQLAAQIVAQSGADLDAVADAHARVYGYPRGDVYEMARRWLERSSLRNPGFFRSIGRGVKRGYHKYRATRLEEKARAQRRKVAQYNPPRSGVLVYDRVLKVFAQKGRGPHRGQRFVHHFRSSPRMLGLPNGDLLITGR